ncbi:hypothetical protein ABGV40_26930 [Paenibacillus amylolyticus]
MTSRIVVTGGAIIRDHMGRVLLQKRSDYGIGDYPVEVWSQVNESKKP